MTTNAKGRPGRNGTAPKTSHAPSTVPGGYDENALIVRRRRHTREFDTFLDLERTFAPTEADWREAAMSWEAREYAAKYGRAA